MPRVLLLAALLAACRVEVEGSSPGELHATGDTGDTGDTGGDTRTGTGTDTTGGPGSISAHTSSTSGATEADTTTSDATAAESIVAKNAAGIDHTRTRSVRPAA